MKALVRLALLSAATAALAQTAPIRVAVDATEAPRRLFRAELTLPVSPGEVSLSYPKWLPGEHGPTGPISELAGLRFTAGGRELPWRRDPGDMFTIRVSVPEGAATLDAKLEFLVPTETSGFSAGASASGKLAVVSWNQLILYPTGASGANLTFEPSLKLPPKWTYGTALATKSADGGEVVFEPVSMSTLIDSPVLAGEFVREIVLRDSPYHAITIAADSEEALAVPPAFEASLRRLVDETGAMFGGRPYRRYRFLLTLSDHVAQFGLEHHESSDNRVKERLFLDENILVEERDLLPHEMVHAWNGKFRRPAGLTFDDFQAPIDSSMLWVYEGLTSYLDLVLAVRSGFMTPDDFLEELAAEAGEMDIRGGRSWRPLEDTAVAAQILYGKPEAWKSRRRSVDFYSEGSLLWLEADVVIRNRTQGKRTLDDFLRSFFKGDGKVEEKPYTFDDVVSALQDVAPYDWRSFFEARVRRVAERAPLGGITGAGYRLVYDATVPRLAKANEADDGKVDLTFSLGTILDAKTGDVTDVAPGRPADAAGLGPGMQVVAVDGRRFTVEWLRSALAAKRPLELLVRNGEYFRTFSVDYAGGERYPRLERDPAVPDLLSKIAEPSRPPAPTGSVSREGNDRPR